MREEIRGVLKRRFKAIYVLLIICLMAAGCGTATAKVDKKLELAVKYLAENNFKEAVLAYNEVIKIDPRNIEAYKGLGLAYTMQKKLDKAGAALKQGLAAVPKSEELKLAMAGILAEQGKAEQAQKMYKELLDVSDSSSVYRAYTGFLSGQGKDAEAIALLQDKIVMTPADYQLSAILAGLYARSGNRDAALVALAASLDAQPDQGEACKNIDMLYRGNWNALVMAGDQYIKSGHEKAGYIMKLYGLMQSGQEQEAIKLFESLPQEVKGSARVKLIAACSYDRLENTAEATKAIQSIDLKKIIDAGMLADLAAYYLDNDKEKAKELALAGIKLDPSVMDNYSIMYQATDDKVWLFKGILGSVFSYQQAISGIEEMGHELIAAGSNGSPGLSKEARSAINSMLPSAQEVARFKAESKGKNGLMSFHSYCYLNENTNIAYIACVFGPDGTLNNVENYTAVSTLYKVKPADAWKVHIFRIHNPNIIPASSSDNPQFQNWAAQHGITQVLEISGCSHSVHVGTFDFEDAVRKGYREAPVVWVDL